MNSKQFKTLIKEAVREVIKEEISSILKEAILNNSKVKQELNEGTSFAFNSNDVIPAVTRVNNGNSVLRAKMNEMYGIGSPQPSPVSPPVQAVVEAVGGDKNPFANLFAQTAMEMTPVDRANLRQLD